MWGVGGCVCGRVGGVGGCVCGWVGMCVGVCGWVCGCSWMCVGVGVRERESTINTKCLHQILKYLYMVFDRHVKNGIII